MFIIRIITIAALIAGGIIAAAPVLLRRFDWMEKPTETLKKFDILIGFILLLIGLFKVFVPEGTASWEYPMTRHFFVGDLFPVIACLTLGFVLTADFLAQIRKGNQEETPSFVHFANNIRAIAGIVGIVVAILHNFLFYYAAF